MARHLSSSVKFLTPSVANGYLSLSTCELKVMRQRHCHRHGEENRQRRVVVMREDLLIEWWRRSKRRMW
ncbi:unnamed protein product [Camellia sinensis]